MGGTDLLGRGPGWMNEVTGTTPAMAGYFFGAMRDQSSRARAFQRQVRWQRLRAALSAEEDAVAEAHLLVHPTAQLDDFTATGAERVSHPVAVG